MKTLKSLIADLGINEQHAVSLMRRRARAALLRDRTKVYASTPLGSIPVFGRRADGRAMSVHDINTDLLTLKLAASDPAQQLQPVIISTAQYVAAWCRLNHLMEC
jgi:hypothetical protein